MHSDARHCPRAGDAWPLDLDSIVRVALGPCTPQPSALPHFHVLTLYISLDNISAMDTRFVLHGITFVWDSNKASTNLRKHGIPFEQGAEAFFDPFLKLVEASRHEEARDAIIGIDTRWNLLFVVHIELEDDAIRIISARKATRRERAYYEA
jgi:uncharacterized DUF497 family protein